MNTFGLRLVSVTSHAQLSANYKKWKRAQSRKLQVNEVFQKKCHANILKLGLTFAQFLFAFITWAASGAKRKPVELRWRQKSFFDRQILGLLAKANHRLLSSMMESSWDAAPRGNDVALLKFTTCPTIEWRIVYLLMSPPVSVYCAPVVYLRSEFARFMELSSRLPRRHFFGSGSVNNTRFIESLAI